MDRLIKKIDKRKKKADKKKKEKSTQKKNSLEKKNKKDKKKQKERKKKKEARDSSTSEESEESGESQRQLEKVKSKLAVDAANIDKKYRMAGSLFRKPEDPPNFARKVLEAEWREMYVDPKVTIETVKTLNTYLKTRAELRSTDHVVIAEKLDDNDKKATTRLKILTKFDEGRFGAIYMVQNESAVDNDVVSVGNSRFIMKTALRQLSSHQIVYRLSREITVLKTLWGQGNDPPPRVPPILHQGKILGVPFYVTSIFDVNLEKCREQMGGGTFCVQSAFHIAQEIFMALKFMHRRQLVHRDVKPTNIALSYQNRDQWYLIDYGDAISVGKKTPISPPDGVTLPFLSLEAHDLLVTSSYSSFQQDLESWFYVIVDLLKPLPWKDNNRIDKVALAKRDFMSRLPNNLTNLPSQILDIGQILKTESPYSEISKKLVEGLASVKTSSSEKWNPEWYDRSATRNLREKKIKNQPRSRESAEAEATAVQTTPTGSTELQNDRRDKSVYVSTIVTKVVDNRKKVSSSNSPTTVSTNKTAVIEDEEDVKKNSPIQKQQDRSVYFNDFPVAAVAQPETGKKKKYRYKMRKQ
ncbi:Protein kinase domain-containing protein [Caenorhabditis elegans]|uniref:Protein kinase domain-containing protein n=1 Tax=Caenorhabditis elegans TaxID=6239 RepID=Q19784_CAEEL|nr:Protein kinase domain-containing protein [Caenorhabditis elegans]CAA84659.2 Protein kinase domain-containing protein [Caenorhabditis elegans]|eukprot:NP_001022549.2 Uncharacterized protein CELE_F25F2.1 [Caenorhabditis elegans]